MSDKKYPTTELKEKFNGELFLEGQSQTVPTELWEYMTKHASNKAIHKKATDEMKEAKDGMLSFYKRYPEAFTVSEENSDIFLFSAGGLTCEIDREETLKVKTSTSEPPPISAEGEAVAKRSKKAKLQDDEY